MPRLNHPNIPNAIYFITLVTKYREGVFARPENAELFLTSLRRAREHNPFKMHGWAILPDHVHLLLQPRGDARISIIVRASKAIFTQQFREARGIPGRAMMWQDGFYDHVIRNDEDYRRHLDYIHYNPVGHRVVQHPEEYRFSSFLSWKERGMYQDRWGWSLRETFGEDDPLAIDV